MKRLSVIITCLVQVIGAMAQTSPGLAQPESVISDGHFLYVTNIGPNADPAAKDGDGFISKLSLDGQMLIRSISNVKLNGPKGTAIIKGVLYVADLERIVGISLNSGKKVVEISLAAYKTNLTNDLAVKDDHTLFVSATDIGKIFEIDLLTGKVKALVDLKGANGIYFDPVKHRLYTCSFHFNNIKGGEIGVVNWWHGSPVYERIGAFQGAFDGLSMIDHHTLLVSDWGALDHPAGFLEEIDLRDNKAVKLHLPALNGPADFYLDAKKKKLFIPILKDAKVLVQPYPRLF